MTLERGGPECRVWPALCPGWGGNRSCVFLLCSLNLRPIPPIYHWRAAGEDFLAAMDHQGFRSFRHRVNFIGLWTVWLAKEGTLSTTSAVMKWWTNDDVDGKGTLHHADHTQAPLPIYWYHSGVEEQWQSWEAFFPAQEEPRRWPSGDVKSQMESAVVASSPKWKCISTKLRKR